MPDATAVCVSVVAPTPAFGARDRAISRILTKVLLEGTDQYSKRQLQALTLGSGQPLKFTVMPDHVRIQLGFAPRDLAAGLRTVFSIIDEASLPQDAIDSAMEAMPFAKPDYWSLALQPEIADYAGIRRDDVVRMYRALFRPDRLSIAVSGPFSPGQARNKWLQCCEDWQPRGYWPLIPGSGPERGLIRPSQPISTLELAGPEALVEGPRFPSQLLTTFALGVGKESAVFRAVRQGLRMSYRQEAFLWPTPGGFRTRVLVAVKPSDNEATLADSARAALLEDVATWNDATRARALAMAQAVYGRGLGLNPMILQAEGAVGESQEDRTFMTAYWQIKTGRNWSETDLLASLESVQIDEMRLAANETLKGSTTRIVSAR